MKALIGPHVLENPDGLGDWLAVSRIRKYCFTFPPEPIGLGDIVICRAPSTDYLSPLDSIGHWKDPSIEAQKFVFEKILPVVNANPHIPSRSGLEVYWELANEPDWKSEEWSRETCLAAMRWYGRFDQVAVNTAASNGLRTIAGNWSTGTPSHRLLSERELWSAYAECGVLSTIDRTGSGIGFHVYDDIAIPGYKAKGHSVAIRSIAGKQIPIFITECGVSDWSKLYPSAKDYAEKYLAPLAIQSGPGGYFNGAIFFTLGGSREWNPFRVDGIQTRSAAPALKAVVDKVGGVGPSEETPEPVTLTLDESKAKGLNIRTGPGVRYQKVDELSGGWVVEEIETQKLSDGSTWSAVSWFGIREREGFAGWVNRRYLREVR